MKDNNNEIRANKDEYLKKSNNEVIEVKSMEEFIELENRQAVIENNILGTLNLKQSMMMI